MVLHTRVMAGTGGGPEKTILRSSKYVDPARYGMVAAYMHPPDDPGIDVLMAQAKEQGCGLIPVADRGPFDWRCLREMGALCDRLDVRIWHGHDYKSNLFGLLLARGRPRMRLISTVHLWTEETWRLKLYRKVDEWCLRRYQRVIAVSEALADRCRQVGVRSDRLVTIHNAIELDDWQRTMDRSEARRVLGLPTDRLILGSVGRLSVQKGLVPFLDIVDQLRAVRPELLWVLVGEGPMRAPLEKKIAELGLADHVMLVGWQTHQAQWYQSLDLLVMPSVREGLPNTLLEAMALSVPVAATAVGGNGELLADGEFGVLLTDPSSSWPKLLSGLLADRERLDRLGEAGRRRIEQAFDFAYRMQQVVEQYDRLLADGSVNG